MKNTFLIIALLVFSKILFAQNFDTIQHRKNVIYLEGLGNVVFNGYSINYERKIIETKNSFITCRAGFSYAFYEHSFVFPILINRIGNKEESSHLEMGIGTAFYLRDLYGKILIESELNPVVAGNIMYRYQKDGGRFVLRAGWTPTYFINLHEHYIGNYYSPFDLGLLYLFDIGASIGYAF
jgi:hypothetical protein